MSKGVGIAIGVAVVLVIAVFLFLMMGNQDRGTAQQYGSSVSSALVDWSYDGSEWQASESAPACKEPLVIPAPVQVNLATSVLYPGQTRTGGYKTHGGFRFDGKNNEDITVTAPLDAYLTRASRYIEQGEVQYLLFFTTPCGIMYRFDHLLTLSPAMQKVIDTLPPAKPDDSRTTDINPAVQVKAGDVIATAVGFRATKNVSVDFGLYDLRKPNTISETNSEWAGQHMREREFAYHGLCFLDYLSSDVKTMVKNLPASGNDPKQSDYCINR